MNCDWEAFQFVCSVEFWRMAIIWPFTLLFSYFQLLFQKYPSYVRSSPDLSLRPICIVTGATSGLGAAAAKHLCRERYIVILAGRSSHLLDKTIQEIKQKQKDAYLEAFQLDLSSFKSIMKFKSSIEQWLTDSNMHPSIQLLINNAGIFATSRRFTSEGYDQMMEANYIGPFALTHLLLPLLKASPVPSRIVNVTSFTHRSVVWDMHVDEETLAGRKLNCSLWSKGYSFAHLYGYSKLCILLFTYELRRQQLLMGLSSQISVMAADPGMVETHIMREVPPILSTLAFTVFKILGLLQSPETGINSIIDAALAPHELSGLYFFGGKGRTIKSSTLSYDTKLAERLWTNSHSLLQRQLYNQGTEGDL